MRPDTWCFGLSQVINISEKILRIWCMSYFCKYVMRSFHVPVFFFSSRKTHWKMWEIYVLAILCVLKILRGKIFGIYVYTGSVYN